MISESESVIHDLVEAALSAPAPASALDRKILEHFPGLVVRKDLTKGLKQNAVVPTYVLEYLLGQHCATDDPEALKAGLESVQRILARHYVHRNQAELVKSTIKERGRHKVIDKLTVELNDKGGFYEAEFTNLGLKKVPIGDDFVRRHPKLLVGGIWCITEVTYELAEDPKTSPWRIDSLKPIQVSHADPEEFLAARARFTTEEWMGLLMQSIGFNPEMFSRRGMLLQLIRLIPYCERNYNLLELGPKGTGKSHVYAEFSPHGILISGSEVTTAKLFVNNSTGRIGLVGYWDCICFDEFAGKDKKVDKALVDIMKNFMANRSFSRGIEQLSAEASMVFMGNTQKPVAYMLKHAHFFEPLPDKYIDSAFLDRIHAFNPGWEVAPIRNELFTSGYGFIVDYLAEILKQQRTEDFTGAYQEYLEIASEVSTRDQTGFEKTFSGLMKILYPHGRATPQEIEELLAFAMEARRRVREQILRIDDTFQRHHFRYRLKESGQTVTVLTPEERQFPDLAEPHSLTPNPSPTGGEGSEPLATPTVHCPLSAVHYPAHIVVPENSKGWSYRRLFAEHLRGARRITVTDPYVRLFFQIRNLMDFLQLVHELVPEGDEVEVLLITQSDRESCVKQAENLNQIVEAFTGSRVAFAWKLDHNPNFHARSITTDTGWKITLDRGLDIFQRYESGPFSLAQAMQEARLTRGVEVSYFRVG
ncbi:MAG: BREX system Lon protease-like protein BrxL [Candidatus Contendobacter sp.]|nr:BREX system Lon protease-like protein BrxL [Candidatus Contendobacter sp.]